MSHRLDFRRLTRPDVLAKIEPQRLRGFLRQVGGSYVADSIDLSADPLPLTEVAELLGTPGEGYPDSLVDALYHAVDFGKDSNAYDALCLAAEQAGFATVRDEAGAKMTPEDLVVALWLDERGQELVRTVHAQHCSANPRSFESFYPKDEAPEITPDFGGTALKAIINDLDDFYDEKRGARGVRLIPVSKGPATWLIVRQPAPWERRVYIGDDGGDEMKQGHPEDYDVLIYHPDRRELSVHAKSKSETTKYREVVGLHAFGDKDRFSEAGRVSLEPLRTLGRGALVVDHIDGIHKITLVEIGFQWNSVVHDRMTRRSDDLFVTFDQVKMPRGRISHAAFKVEFIRGRPAPSVRVHAGARTSYDRDATHDCVKEWLVDRGFLRLRGRVPPAALVNLWRALADEADAVMTRAEWDALLGDGAGPAAGLLQPVGGPAPTHPCGLCPGQGCRMVFQDRDDDGVSTYRCGDQPTRCDGAVLSKGKAAGYSLNLGGLAQVLGDAVGAEGDIEAPPEPGVRIWALGTRRIGGTMVDFWFSPGAAEADLIAAVNVVRSRRSAGLSCLLVPSVAAVPGRVLEVARLDAVLVLGLDKAGSVAGGDLAVDLWPLLDAHRQTLRDADPTAFCGDRFDLVLDPARDRYWCFGRPVTFGKREQPARLLLRALARDPGVAVSFEELQAAHPDVIAPTSRASWPQYRQKLMKALASGRKKADPDLPEDLVEPTTGGGYVLRIPPSRVEWWTREPSPMNE